MICIGPMSSEIIEAVFAYSSKNKKPLSLISSKNQIDYNGGYVNLWNTKQYMDYIGVMRMVYPKAQVNICRDHCGPGFNGNYNLDDVYNTIKEDIERGFDLIHIDFCHHKGSKKEVIKESIYAIEYAKSIRPDINFEIGTDEITEKPSYYKLKKNLDIFLEYCNPKYYVVNTGSLVKDFNQVGYFDENNTRQCHDILSSYGIALKEHNADYLSEEQIELRNNKVGAMNIAPQLGVEQTRCVLEAAKKHDINCNDFLNASYDSNKWTKWIYHLNPNDKYNLAVVAGHYNYSSEEYQDLMYKLKQKVDINKLILDRIIEIIEKYDRIFVK